MDCDADDISQHNLQLASESRPKSSVVLRPYDFPKFDFDDNLQSHLRFDTLVETEVFLGIQSQEDNQWIEDFSPSTNGMEFNSTPRDSCPISKGNNVWSEATSSESVEMLLKSVGQEEMIPRESSISESNHSNSEIKSPLNKHLDFPASTSGKNVTSSNEGEKAKERDVCDWNFGMFTTTEVSVQVGNVSFKDPNGNEQSNEKEESEISEVKTSEASVSVRTVEVSGGCVEDVADRKTKDGYDLKPPEVNSQNVTSKIPIQIGKNEDEVEVLPTNIEMARSFEVCQDENDIGSQNTNEAHTSALKGEGTCELPLVFGDNNNKDLLESGDGVDVTNGDKSLSSNIESFAGENKADSIVLCHDDSLKYEEKSGTQLPDSVLNDSHHASVFESELDICETSKDKEVPTYVGNVNLKNVSLSSVVDDGDGDGIEEKVVVPTTEIGSASVEQDGEPEIANRPDEIAHGISSDVDIETEVVNTVEDEVAAIVKSGETSVKNDERNTESPSTEAVICLNSNHSHDNSSLKESTSADLVSCGHQEETTAKVEREKEREQCAETEKASCGSSTIISSSDPSQTEKDSHEDVRDTEVGNQFVTTQPVSEVPKRKGATGDDSTFTFKVNALPNVTEGEPGRTWSPLLNAEKCNPPLVVVETNPSSEGKSERTPKQKTPHQNTLTSTREQLHGTPKGTSERKGRKASTKGTTKENIKKGNQISDVNNEGALVDKGSVTLTSSSSGKHVPSDKRQLYKHIEQSKTNLSDATVVPDLNNSASNNNSSRQPFSDLQQVQLRAQIFVYGSLIQGTAPDEACMVSAFGSSDGRNFWEPVWRAAIERVRSQKCNSSAVEITPLHPKTVTRASDTKQGSGSSMVTSSPVARAASSKGTPTTVGHPIIPLPSPLWGISTPSRDNFPLNSTHKGPIVDYQHAISPIRNFVGHTLWPSQLCYPNPWLASPQINAFTTTSGHFQPVTVTETVKLTPVRDSSTPLTSTPVQSHIGASLPPDSVTSKSRKRKKSQTPSSEQISLLSEPRTEPAFVPSPVSETVPNKTASPEPKEVATCAVKTLSEVADAKSHADDAASLAAATITHCENVWRQLTKQKVSGLTCEVEARLATAAASITVAASVAKAAASAARVACNIAVQSKSMADEAFNSDKTSGFDPSGEIVDAIAKAAELAAAAVFRAGKIVGMGEPLTLTDMIEAGPDGCWSQPSDLGLKLEGLNKERCGVENRANDGLANDIQHSVHDGKEVSDDAKSCEMGYVPSGVGVVGNNRDEVVGVDSEDGIKEGSVVEVYKCGDSQKSAWFSAYVLTLENDKAYLRYADLPSEEGSGSLCEWVNLKSEGDEAPVIRTVHPLTSLHHQGTRKRRRAALGDYAWCIGDRVDVWIHDRWQEGVVTEKNEKDATTLKVNFPAHGETSIVKSWNLRMSRFWKDGKWVECSSTKDPNVSEQSDTPQEKRQRRGSLTVLAKGKDKLRNDAGTAFEKPEESKLLDLSISERKFDIGKTTKQENKRLPHRPLRSGQPKQGPKLVFGVPNPSWKKRKFMEVSKQFPPNNNEKKNESTNPVKFAKFLMPQSRNDSNKEKKQTLRKPSNNPNSTSGRNVNVDNDEEVMQKSVEAPLSSLIAQTLSSSMKKISSFTFKSGPLNRGKPASTVGKLSKIDEDKDAAEPRRSNRRIQPTHRLLEGLQSSMMILKMPTVSHDRGRMKPTSRNVPTKGK